MRNNIIYLICAACLVAACAEEQRFENINPTPGVEVAFSAITNESPETKTLYGTDADDKTGLKVKWVNGDKIKIYGTTCSVKEAEYSVQATTAATNTPNTDDGQNYADNLIKTGAAGVQWGSEESSDFYAVYPSNGASFTQNSDGSVKINTTINATQNYLFNDEPTTIGNLSVWEGTHFGSDATDPSMLNAIMYAYTNGAKATDESGNPKQVDLHFKPFSTVLKFRFMGYTSELANVQDPTVYVQNITITAPEGYNIAGDFSLAIAGNGGKDVSATANATGKNSNSITLNTILAGGTYLPLKQGQAVDFNVFTVPLEDLMLGGDVTRVNVVDENGKQVTNADGTNKTAVTCEYPWKVTIKTQAHGTFEYTVIPNVQGITELKVGSTLTAKAYELNAGHIHKIKVPMLTLKTQVDWNPKNWITQIPTPVYVSELSVPGAWYAGHLSAYQDGASLTELYTAGVRAFHIDCLMCPDEATGGRVSGVKEVGDRKLICAGTQNAEGFLSIDYTQGTYVETMLNSISEQIKNDEYVIVVLTIAEKPQTWSIGSLQTITIGSVNPSEVIPAITNLINTKGESLKVYGYYDSEDGKIKTKGKTLTKDTTIDDVLGTMIIKINTNTDALSSYTFPTYSLVSFGSMASDLNYNTSNDNITNLPYDYFASMRQADMLWGNSSSGLKYYYHQAQKTTIDETNNASQDDPIPTLKDRKTAIDEIIKESKQIYDNAAHDVWFQMGIGGYNENNANDKSSVSDVLNSYLQKKIEEKMEKDPSPVGIVLMNNCLDYTNLIQDIIEMNGKFYLNRQGGSITTGGTDDSGSGTTPSQAKNAAYAVVGDDAF